jgi:hypothetical protein
MPAPAIVHAHALLFMGWVGIVLTQVWLSSVVAGTPQADSKGLDFPSPR